MHCEEHPTEECPADTYPARETLTGAYSADDWPSCPAEEPPVEETTVEAYG